MTTADTQQSVAVARKRVFKNTLVLVIGKVLALPISIATNALMARYVGPSEYGSLFLVQTYVGFGFILVNWGQSGTLPGAVSKDRSQAGNLLGSALVWRLGSAIAVAAVLAIALAVLHTDDDILKILGLVALTSTITALAGAYQDVIRGFERTDVDATASVLGPLMGLLVAAPVLFLGGRVQELLICDSCLNLGLFIIVRRVAQRLGVVRGPASRDTLRLLVVEGWGFLLFAAVMAAQPTIDAAFLSRYTSPEVIGWHAAARKLIGLLVFPVNALIGGLYPSLCRLHAEDQESFAHTARDAVRTSALFVMPVAVGCALFPDIGVGLFSRQSYGPAEDNLRILALFILFLYFTMPLGTTLLAAGRQRAWSLVQSGCLVVSLVADPLLVPWFQAKTGNGGLGVCVTSALSEGLMLLFAILLMPKGVLDRGLFRGLGLAFVAGGAMAVVGRGLHGMMPSLVLAPIAVLAYVATLMLLGVLTLDQARKVGSLVATKFGNR